MNNRTATQAFEKAARRLLAPLLLFALFVSGCVNPDDAGKKPLTNHVIDWRDEIIYQLMVDRFENGDPNNDYNVDVSAPAGYHGGDYQGVIDRLDYLEELGVTALWISPVVKNVEEDAGVGGYHGYWTQNFLQVNPHFGDLAKLRQLVDRCHERGIKVILDIVTNHIGQLFYYDINKNGQPNEQVLGSGTESPLTRTTEWDPDFDSRGIQAVTGLGASGRAPIEWVWQPEINRVPPWPPEFANPDWYNRMGRVTVWGRETESCCAKGLMDRTDCCCAGHLSGTDCAGIDCEQAEALPYWRDAADCEDYIRLQEVTGDFPGGLKDVRTELAEVREKMVEVYSYWIEAADFDGFRIDTLKHVEHGFWRHFCPGVRENAKLYGKKNFFMFGEAFDGDDPLLGSYTQNEEVDSVFYFSQKFQVFDGVVKSGAPTKNIEALWNNRYPDAENPEDKQYYGTEAHVNGPVDEDGRGIEPYRLLVNFLDNHDLPRFLWRDDGGPGYGCIPEEDCSATLCDNGDWAESGLCGREGETYSCSCDRKTLRLALSLLFTMDGIPCLYYGTEQDFNGGNDPSNREDLWRSGFRTEGGTFQWVKKLTALRKELAPLRRGHLKVVWSTEHTGDEPDAGIFAFERTYKNERVLVVLNTHKTRESRTTSGDAAEENMPTSFAPGTTLTDRLSGGGGVTVDAQGRLDVRVPAQGIRVFTP